VVALAAAVVLAGEQARVPAGRAAERRLRAAERRLRAVEHRPRAAEHRPRAERLRLADKRAAAAAGVAAHPRVHLHLLPRRRASS
jgi:hypothetical protein